MTNLNELLEPIASQFRSMGIPESVVHWGHPAMMAIVVFVMGSVVGLTGWRGRVARDEAVTGKSLTDHRILAPWMFLFMAAGYTGGVLSLVMQRQPILESPHFWTGSTVLLLLTINAAIALTGFGRIGAVSSPPGIETENGLGLRSSTRMRTVHAYLGSTALCILFLHVVLGLKLGLALP